MKLKQLYYFREAVKYKSISIAAEENYISQPAFSSSITSLEKDLGVNLLNRTTKGVTPTEAGNIVLEKANIIFNTIDDLMDEIAECNTHQIVKLSSITMIYNNILPQIIVHLNQTDNPINLHVSTNESANIYEAVTNGEERLGIVIYDQSLLNNDLNYVPLLSDRYVLCVGKKSRFWNNDSVTLNEALKEPYIAYREEFKKKYAVWTSFNNNQILPNIAFRTDDIELLKKMIAQDNYVAFFPEFLFQEDVYLRHREIRCIPISDDSIEVEIGYIYNAKYKLNSTELLFLQVLKDEIKKLAINYPHHLLLI